MAPATRSEAALTKAARHTLDDDSLVHSFGTLLGELATIARNTCRTPIAPAHTPTFDIFTAANAKQQRAMELLQQIYNSPPTQAKPLPDRANSLIT